MSQIKYDHINKFVQCYCDKRQTIQFGWGYLIYANIFALVAWIVFAVAAVIVLGLEPLVILPVGLAIISVYLAILGYQQCYKDMKNNGHTESCSRKIAKRATWYQSLYSEFKIGVDPKIVDPEGDYVTIATGLWFMTVMVNWFFSLEYSDQKADSVVYPLLFIFSIVLSIIQLFRIKNMSRLVVIVYALNIATSNLLLSLYLLDLFVKFAP